jgi:non-specific serine/threonine protein kinase
MTSESTPDFSDLLRRARRVAGLTQEALAERAGVSVRAISDLERGINRAPRRDTLDMLVEALDLPAEEQRQWERSRRRIAVPNPPDERSSVPSNLPAPLTSFVGRERVRQEIASLLKQPDTRLVTLTGAGGVGKTRLALAVAGELKAAYADGIWFVNLAPIVDQSLVLSTIASTLGVQESATRPLVNSLADELVGKRLLVLDNFEHVVDAALSIAALLGAAPTLNVLVTSRVPLHLSGEHLYPVQPLELPSREDRLDLDRLSQFDAIHLFRQRAQAILPTFQITPDNAETIVDICSRLDGLPLALELAAARIHTLPPNSLLQRLDHRLKTLTSGARDVPARHQTLRGTIAWSYDLLIEDERAIFRCLSVFRGGWTAEAAESVAAHALSLDAMDGLEHLIEHSLIRVHERPDGTTRYSMLETIREFGLEQLQFHEEIDEVYLRHASYFTNDFSHALEEWSSSGVAHFLARGDAELDNVRAAIAWAVDHDAELALQLSRSFSWYWLTCGPQSEARRWLDLALASNLPATSSTRANALSRAGMFAVTAGDYATGQRLTEEGLALYQDLGERRGIAECLYGLGRISMFNGDYDEAERLFAESVDLFLETNIAFAVSAISNLSQAIMGRRDYQRAEAMIQQGLALARQHSGPTNIAFYHIISGLVALKIGNLTGAKEKLVEGVTIMREMQEVRHGTHALEMCAWLAAAEGQPERVARLLGAVSKLRETLGMPIPHHIQLEYNEYVPLAQRQLNAAIWARAWSDGREMTLDEAFGYAQSTETL